MLKYCVVLSNDFEQKNMFIQNNNKKKIGQLKTNT